MTTDLISIELTFNAFHEACHIITAHIPMAIHILVILFIGRMD